MPTLEDRLAALETSVRRWRYATLGLVLILAVAGTVAAALQPEIPEVIKARKIEVVDRHGMTVVNIQPWPMGGSISVWGKREPDKPGTLTTRIAHTDTGDGLLRVKSKAGDDLIALGSRYGNGLLSVASQAGTNLMVAGSGRDGNGMLVVNSKEGKTAVGVLGRGEGGFGGSVVVANKTGESVAAMMVDKFGNGNVGVFNRKGEGRVLKPGP